jgi:hypothetical protein
MSPSVRCLLDKAAARRTLEGLLRLAEGRELTEEQLTGSGREWLKGRAGEGDRSSIVDSMV